MKKEFSKNLVIGFLLLCVGAMGFYILAKEAKFKAVAGMRAERPKPKTTSPRAAHGEIKEALLKVSDFQACYEDYLRRTPAADEGSIVVHWMIDQEGHLDLLKLIRSDFEDIPFTDCVVETIKNTRFPAFSAKAGMIISHKFNFHRKGDRAEFQ